MISTQSSYGVAISVPPSRASSAPFQHDREAVAGA
jgi:hypothetical protein